jgi:hypothetical protein
MGSRCVGAEVSDRESHESDRRGGREHPGDKRDDGGERHPAAATERERGEGEDDSRHGQDQRPTPQSEDPGQSSSLPRD